MISNFPTAISKKGIFLYLISLILVSIIFLKYAIGAVWMILGFIEILVFFLMSNKLSSTWQRLSAKDYARDLFIGAFLLRLVWVVFSYFFFISQNGDPFEFDAADSWGYHHEAEWLMNEPWSVVWGYYSDFYLDKGGGVSDLGYPLYLMLLYRLIGSNIFVARVLKAIYGAITCVLLYKLAARNLNEQVGRIAGIFAMVMPNLIIYCGLHLKETEMIFLIVAFLERTDYVLRERMITWGKVILPLLLAVSLFLFRTVLGVLAFFSVATALLFSPNRTIRLARKLVVTVWVILAVAVLAGGTIRTEIEGYWNDRGENQAIKREVQTKQGNQWAKYATGTVMAPMAFVIPFSTMVDTDQQNQLVLHAGNYVRNYMGIFVLIFLFTALFVKKNWRDFSLIGSFVIGYLGVVSMSGFANSERFLLPGLPCLILMWAYGISELNAKNYKFVNYWSVVVILMEVGWAYFKIGSRGWDF